MKIESRIQKSGVRRKESEKTRYQNSGSWILAPEFFQTLLRWYHRHKRDLPWRQTKDPYKIWISEIMLQQTQVSTVIDYYPRFIKRFPTLQSLAQATEEEVLALWSGLGYYSRAKNLHKAARQIVQKHKGKFPKEPEEIKTLPGIGKYTLGAIVSIAFNLTLPVVDGNVMRVYARLFALKGSPSESKFQKKIWKIAEEAVFELKRTSNGWRETGGPGDFNQALMELGAIICTPQNPACLICPVNQWCQTRTQVPENYPEKKKLSPTKALYRIATVIHKNYKVLLTLSEKNRWMKKLWQLPGVFAENKEGLEKQRRELLKKMGLSSKKMRALKPFCHKITHHKITVFPYYLEHPQEDLPLLTPAKKRWVLFSELDSVALPAADRKILDQMNREPK